MSSGAPRTWQDVAAAPREIAKPCATAFESIALLLQGGGALGAYQAGVYQKLCESNLEPTWIAGISIGAINSAIIAGNPPGERVARLRDFWDLASDAGDNGWGDCWTAFLTGDRPREWLNQVSAARIIARGVPGFFSPRMPPPYLMPNGGGATSYYNTSELKPTLERLVDFDRINAREMRLSIGAVNVRTGNFSYFDNENTVIRPEHVMASGALPPAFDAVEIDGEFYWDGGLVSNTPLDWVLSSRSGLDTLILQVDLWNARGMLPKDFTDVAVRMKEVQFSSRTRSATDAFSKVQELRAAFNELLAQMPPELAATPQARMLAKASDPAVYNIVQLIYRSATYEGQAKDFEFSRRTMEEHWRAGYDDATATLLHPEVLTLPIMAQGVAVYDFLSTAAHPRPVESEKKRKI